jgi:hypothetical protein
MRGLRLGLSLTGGGPTIRDNGLTNLLTNAQAFDNASWVKGEGANGPTISANDTAAPDDSMTADTLTAPGNGNVQINQLAATTVSATYTASVFVPAGGTAAFAYIQINSGTVSNGAAFISINRSTGAVSAQQDLIAGLTLTGAATKVHDGWMLAVTFVARDSTMNVFFGMANTATSRTVTSGKTLPLWQGQAVAGSAPGPLDYA